MLLNGLMASPTFADWIEGQPLDIDSLLHEPVGQAQGQRPLHRPPLGSGEAVLCHPAAEQVVSWMRAQSGTTSLRALLYMDEMFGYLPPHPANPPTKKPLLTLLKQARAFGLGLVLATQNPVDLDYKALSNAGTWFIGRMQTDRDKQRLLDGLEGVAGGHGRRQPGRFRPDDLGARVAGISAAQRPRGEPVVFHTRWAMSYLRGPLTRPQVQELVASRPSICPGR